MEETTEDAEEAQTAAEEVAEDSVAVDEAVENEAVDEAVENEEASDQDTKKNLVFSKSSESGPFHCPFSSHRSL